MVGSLEPLRKEGLPFLRCSLAALGFIALLLPLAVFFFGQLLAADLSSVNGYFLQGVAQSLGFSLLQALLTALLSAGLALVFVLPWVSAPAASLPARILVIVENIGSFVFALPGVVMALWVLALSQRVSFFPAKGLWALVLAHVLFNIFFLVGVLSRRFRSWLAQNRDEIEAAQLMNASRPARFRNFVWPLFKQEMRQWLPVVFAAAFSAFSTLVILGGGPPFANLEVLLYFNLANDFEGLRILLLALLQAAVAGVFFYRAASSAGRENFSSQPERSSDFGRAWPGRSFLLGAVSGLGLAAVSAVFAFFFAQPFLDLAASSFALPLESMRAAAVSVGFAGLAALLAALLCVGLVGAGRTLRKLFLGAAGFSSTLLAAAWMGINLDIRLGAWPWARVLLAALAMALVLLPWMSLWTERRWAELLPQNFEAARLMGLGPWARFRHVALPAFSDIVFKVSALAFLGALGEMSFVSFFLPDVETLATLSRRLAYRYDFAASAWIVIVMMFATLMWALGTRLLRLRRLL